MSVLLPFWYMTIDVQIPQLKVDITGVEVAEDSLTIQSARGVILLGNLLVCLKLQLKH